LGELLVGAISVVKGLVVKGKGGNESNGTKVSLVGLFVSLIEPTAAAIAPIPATTGTKNIK
jgi:hypothetical protein